MKETCVVHLVRARNGIGPLQRFLESYRRNPAGTEHDLLLIFKGFGRGKLPVIYETLVHEFPHVRLFLPDKGLDVTPYIVAASTHNYHFFCFFNSFSVLLDKDWLAKMYAHATREGVGLVGATGSYQSPYTDIEYFWELVKATPIYRRVLNSFTIPRDVRWRKANFYPFPNPHIRTNGFMIARDVIRAIKVSPIRKKMDAYVFESGKNGLTQQIFKMNLRALVVGKNGRAYEREEWVNSLCFWQGDQGNLLVADNQTNAYSTGDLTLKWKLARHAWGEKGNPLHRFEGGNQDKYGTEGEDFLCHGSNL